MIGSVKKQRSDQDSSTVDTLLSLGGPTLTNPLATSRAEVSIPIGNVSFMDLIAGTQGQGPLAKSAELTSFEDSLKKAGMIGGLMAVPYLSEPSLDDSGPRLKRDESGAMSVVYQTCRIEAKTASGAYEWFPEVVKVNWTAASRIEGNRASGSIDHFADKEVASRWAKYAKALTSDAVKISALDKINPKNGSFWQFTAQAWFVHDCFNAIAQFYNALNIPWHTDPTARDMYRLYLAGSAGGDRNFFTKDLDHNENGWYHKGHWTDENHPIRLRARLMPDKDERSLGLIPRSVREAFNRIGPFPAMGLEGESNTKRPIDFRVTAGLTTWDLAFKSSFEDRIVAKGNVPIDYSNDLYNRAFVNPASMDWARMPDGSEAAVVLQGAKTNEELIRLLAGTFISDLSVRLLTYPYLLTGYICDWRAFSWSQNPFGNIVVGYPPWQCTAPLRSYLNWAIDWAASIASRSPEDVLSKSRANVIATNWGWTRSLGSEFAEIAATATSRAETEGKGSDLLQAVASIGGEVGASIPNPKAQLIAGAVSSVLSLVNKFIRFSPPKSTARDDLGRWKPIIERAYLGGDPLSDVPAQGIPRFIVPTLPGFCRTRAPVAPSSLRPEDETPPPPPPPSPSSEEFPLVTCPEGQTVLADGTCGVAPAEQGKGLSTTAKVAIGVGAATLVVGGGAFLIYTLTRKK